ncbi:MAG: penicillin acylase family protein [Chloroflexi bacterium]|nr:penicillin acylase family protein [Chloroflexota bacterium]
MKLLKRILQVFVIVIVLLVVVGGVGGYWFITKSLPQINGTLQVAGLKSKVEIVRDPMGIPHIYADNVDDLFFAEGYVQAQDRLWQMEYNRRIGHGTLSDIFGATTIKTDRFLRTIGLDRSARADYAAMSEADKRPLQAFANGVNAFIDSHLGNLPLEFTILGFKPAHWEPVDTIAWGKVMAYDLGGNYDAELLRARIAQKLGDAAVKQLMPPYPAAGPFTIPPEAKNYQSLITNDKLQMPNLSIGTPDLQELASLDEMLGKRGDGIGSNNWVVDGAKSTTGKPILVNDPHLGIQLPSIWYEVGLHCMPKTDACPYNVAGYTFAGVMGVVIGHNDKIAWAVTNVGPDVQDLYVEEINPQNPNQYKFNGKWEDMQVVEEPIKVKGVVSETLKVQITRHGPIMTPVVSGMTQPVALQWTVLRERSRLFDSVLAIDRAQNWNEFRNALKMWDAPSQNFVFADLDGNIGYQTPGNIPIRAKGDGTMPVPGTGEYEWTGYIPFDELPFVYNPPTHFIATANQAIVPPTYKYSIASDWASPYRKQRIDDLLKAKEKISIDDMKAIQSDVYAIPLVTLQKSVLTLKPEGFLQTRALDQVKAWDGRLTTDSVGGTILEATYQRLFNNIFAGKLDKDLLASYYGANDYHRRVISALLDDPKNPWWGSAGRDAILQTSFAEGVDWLGSQFGDAPTDWKWGRLHIATFNHPLGSVQPLDLLFNAGPVAAPGGVNTVFATSFKVANNKYNVSSVSSMRMIVDLSNLGNSLQTHTTGQSGQPLSKHFSDMVLLWRDVQYAPFYFDRAALDKVKEGVLVLQP